MLQVRLHLSAWIEEKFSPSVPFSADSPGARQTASALAQELVSQLDARVAAMPDDPDKYLMRAQLGEIAENLKVRTKGKDYTSKTDTFSKNIFSIIKYIHRSSLLPSCIILKRFI